MIEIQLMRDGPWIPLIRALTSSDLGIGEAQRILNAGLWGIRVVYEGGGIAFVAWRYVEDSTLPGYRRFAWRSSQMGAPAFADL